MNTVRANKWLLLVSSLGTLVLLGAAAYRENVAREWRRLQRDYAGKLPPAQQAAFTVQLRQVYNPALHASDRCISCHVGMAPGETAIKGDRVFGPHPDVVHDPLQYGCVVCHAGQGRATEQADAHGTAPFWPEPMLPRKASIAGCGACHTHVAVPKLDELRHAQALVERNDCLACHGLDGRGGTLRPGAAPGVAAPDLSRVGAKGYNREWYAHHMRERAAASEGPWRTSMGEIAPEDQRLINVFLDSRVGAPRLVDAKATFHTLGCRGCHKIGGVGGDDGPDLSREGEKDPARLDYTHVPGDHTLASWLGQHFRAPGAVAPGSQMPVLGLSEAQINALVLYVQSLRRSSYPEAYWPKDRVLAQRFGAREFATDGATLYGTFCAACHGPGGEGMRYPGMAAFPAIGNPDFLAVASNRFIAATVQHGRPGRRMPAWGEAEGGLRPAEIEAVVAHVRGFAPGVAPPSESEPPRWVRGNVDEGQRLYQANCAACHGAQGEGREGPQLHNQVLLKNASDRYLVETVRRGRRRTSMPNFANPGAAHRQLADAEIEAIVTFLRTWEVKG
jgi:cbb3-type cytochrome c oxidase subunit III